MLLYQIIVGEETARKTFLSCLFRHYDISMQTNPLPSARSNEAYGNEEKNCTYTGIADVI